MQRILYQPQINVNNHQLMATKSKTNTYIYKVLTLNKQTKWSKNVTITNTHVR